jgi:hypothetical protein
MEMYKVIRRYGVIEYFSELTSESGHYKLMWIRCNGQVYFIRMHNGEVLEIK